MSGCCERYLFFLSHIIIVLWLQCVLAVKGVYLSYHILYFLL
ncbi:WD repeat-containing protein 43 [Frankliniella fusca]|uniref:WD repeat-containing protein 43 n=1 Tax=Frankliniella fusca TaxID=407009 RepID=A0AAE1I498_9NEOP|nr:WD repeat-containing protein 43 [Frankliniella fusca]